jgi:hypothetical protein
LVLAIGMIALGVALGRRRDDTGAPVGTDINRRGTAR